MTSITPVILLLSVVCVSCYRAPFHQSVQESIILLRNISQTYCVDKADNCEDLLKTGGCQLSTPCRRSCGVCHEISRIESDSYLDVMIYALRNAQRGHQLKPLADNGPTLYHLEDELSLVMHLSWKVAFQFLQNEDKFQAWEEILSRVSDVLSKHLPDPEIDLVVPAGRKSVTTKFLTTTFPRKGLNTWKLAGENCTRAVLQALNAGYRHIETAHGNRNFADIARALKQSSSPRSEIFLTSQLSELDCTKKRVRIVVEEQLAALQTDYIDLFLIGPITARNSLRLTWLELEKMVQEGKIRALGVKDFVVGSLKDFVGLGNIKPSVLQTTFNPYRPGSDYLAVDHHSHHRLVRYCQENQIQLFGSSVASPGLFRLNPTNDPHIVEIAKRLQKRSEHVLYQWAVQSGVAVTMPEELLVSGAAFSSFVLSETDMALIDGLRYFLQSQNLVHNIEEAPDVYGVLDIVGRTLDLRMPASERLREMEEAHIEHATLATVIMTNKWDHEVKVYWWPHDQDELVEVATIHPGESIEETSYIGHVYVVKGPNGEDLQEIMIRSKQDTHAFGPHVDL